LQSSPLRRNSEWRDQFHLGSGSRQPCEPKCGLSTGMHKVVGPLSVHWAEGGASSRKGGGRVTGGFDHPVRCASAGCVTAAQLVAAPLDLLGLYGSAALRRLSSAEPATKYAVVLIGPCPSLALEQIRMNGSVQWPPLAGGHGCGCNPRGFPRPVWERSAVSVDQVNTGSVAGCSGLTESGR